MTQFDSKLIKLRPLSYTVFSYPG